LLYGLASLNRRWPSRAGHSDGRQKRGAGEARASRGHNYVPLPCARVLAEVVRSDWERAFRQLEAQRSDGRRYRNLLEAVEVVTAELRARVGQNFTVDELLRAYADVERWGREAVAERAAYEGWSRDLALVEDAAFHLYARGASDFEP